MAREEVCEKLSVFCMSLFGIVTASSLSPAALVAGSAAAALSLPIVFSKWRGMQRPEPHPTMVGLQRHLVRDYDRLARTGEIKHAMIPRMEAAIAAMRGG